MGIRIDGTNNNLSGSSGTIAISAFNTVGVAGSILTSNGTSMYWGPTASSVPSGSLMLFQQTAAPTGWTKQTTHDNKALRVVSGTCVNGGSTAFTSVFTSRGVPLAEHSHGVSDPGHAHNIYTGRNDNPNYHEQGGQRGHIGNGFNPYDNLSGWVIGSGTGISIANAGTAGASMDFAVQYVDLIIASKN